MVALKLCLLLASLPWAQGFAPRASVATRQHIITHTAKSAVEPVGPQIFDSLSQFARHSGKCVVVKYGGHAMSDERAAECFAEDIVLMQKLGLRPVVVHGGGPQIGNMLKQLNTTSTFIDGLRVTDAATVKVSEMLVKERIGEDGHTEIVDLGFVGEPTSVNSKLLQSLLDNGIIPVIAPIATGAGGATYSVNADTAAGAVAEALSASRLLLLTDVTGVLDENMKLISSITPTSANELIKSGVIKGGMIPKVQTALQAVEGGVEGAAIVDGRVDHSVLKELFSVSGAGTLVTCDEAEFC
ncbi:acetyl-CoA:L-glutamate N-acetyltransferase [Aureococcus anophagefferens]|nr:acetyl-CoA:L-glutamate N-acetyltransferase [Aureococcus anophagefferens]